MLELKKKSKLKYKIISCWQIKKPLKTPNFEVFMLCFYVVFFSNQFSIRALVYVIFVHFCFNCLCMTCWPGDFDFCPVYYKLEQYYSSEEDVPLMT